MAKSKKTKVDHDESSRSAHKLDTDMVAQPAEETQTDKQTSEELKAEVESAHEQMSFDGAADSTADNASGTAAHAKTDESGPSEKIELNFFGSELLRAKFPKPFQMAETVATEWVKGGDFSDLPIENPLAHYAARKGLLQAKELEKKVLESPVTEKIAMQVLTAGMKAQGFVEQVRARMKKD